jgi:ribonuclease VapC
VIVDTSAVLAVLFHERDAARFAQAIAAADRCRISAANFAEAALAVDLQTDAAGDRQFDSFFRRSGIAIEPVTEEQAHLARQAYFDFGKGRHPAGLNFGDCCLCARQGNRRTVVVQGQRLLEDRHRAGLSHSHPFGWWMT